MTDLICRDELDRLKPCAFCPHCHAARQLLHHEHRIRGRECWAFVMLSDKLGIRPASLTPEDAERAAIEDESGIPQEKNEP